jgi:peptidoglycan/LPS O-acetylase OafA/YrhL
LPRGIIVIKANADKALKMIKLNYRNQQVDFLRGMAILVVLILHFNLSYHLDQSALNNIFSLDFIKRVASNGNYGVTMFFVISGFLITTTSLERYGKLSNVDVVGFYIFRFARIMPCLVLALTIIFVFNLMHISIFENSPHTTSMFLGIFSVLTFWHNILMEKIGYFNYCLNIYWSLSVEEIFYITFPLLCFFFKKTRFIIPIWLALIIIGPIYRSFYTQNEIVALYGYLSCFDAIAIGCCAALLAQKIKFTRWTNATVQYGAGLLLVGVYLYSGIMNNVVIGVSLMAIGTALLLIIAKEDVHEKNSTPNLATRIVCWFGKNSYELYLFHIIVLALMREICPPGSLGNYSKLVWMVIFFSLSALIAGTISRIYSQPLNKKLREYLLMRRSQKVAMQIES